MTHQPFVWKKENEIGIPELDEQHEHFFQIANEIFILAEKPISTREEVLQKMANLADYAFYHFDTEEGMLKGLPKESVVDHLKEHDRYREVIRSFLDAVRASPADPHALAQDIAVFANDYVTKHMMGGFEHHAMVKRLVAKEKGKR